MWKPAAVGSPAGPSGVAPVELVRVGESGGVLLPELVFRGGRVRVSPLPERLDEGVAEVLALEVPEGLALRLGDDVDGLLLDPGAVPGRHLRLRPRRRRGGERDRQADSKNERELHCGSGATVTGRPVS